MLTAPSVATARRQARGENRWPAAIAVLAASGLQMTLPPWLAFGPHWLLPAAGDVAPLTIARAVNILG
jgi:hypothetical protein